MITIVNCKYKYYITTKCTAGRSHPATTSSKMEGTQPPKLTNQDSQLSLTIGASLFPMGCQDESRGHARGGGRVLSGKVGTGIDVRLR